LRGDMDRLWDRFFGERLSIERFRGEWAPSLDVSETKDNIVVKAEIPGMDQKEIDISFASGSLIIRGEKKQEREEKEENDHMVERRYGVFSKD
jgi:HSP20 family protein